MGTWFLIVRNEYERFQILEYSAQSWAKNMASRRGIEPLLRD